MDHQAIPRRIFFALAGGAVLGGLYLSNLYNYLLFHTLTEVFSIVVAGSTFTFTWNSRRFLENQYLLFLGIGFLFIGALDLVHTLAYKGMPIFVGYTTNLPTQVWIAARYLQSISLLVAPLFFYRPMRTRIIFVGYSLVSILLLTTIFGGVFPDCYIEGVGLTPFKKLSEYLIALLLVGSIGLLLHHRQKFDPGVLRLLVWAIICTIAAELAFTTYISVYDLANLAGHCLKIVAFYLIYKAIIETGLVKPYSVLLRDFKQREEILQQSTVELQARNEDLNAFAHTAAHDLKGPLSNIILCSSLLKENILEQLDQEQAELLQAIEDTAFKMNAIIDSLLLLAAVRQAPVKAEPLDMGRIVAEVKRRLARMLEEYRGEVIFPTVWPSAWGYGPWIEEVWANYISNALEYGGRPPRLELGAAVQPDNRVKFWVRDNGPGLTPEEQDRLFNVFTQLKQARLTGHGLGLSIVKRIVEKLNGQVGVESAGPGQGSLFFFTLPGGVGG